MTKIIKQILATRSWVCDDPSCEKHECIIYGQVCPHLSLHTVFDGGVFE